ncbi:MAG: hypothetical protein CVV13_04935 [Gammaproteobacteria bacterium HGW-Gammaproteobacteria-3]|nr:MAG: hypothetical protein CVV13_04935 [Gammaproteobacteria bacterium HGW-Gammaproteobacteria-3]
MIEKRLRVLTYNIHKGFNVGNRRFVLHQIRDALVATDADVLLLQEIQGTHQHKAQKVTDWPELSQCEFIAEGIWPHFAYGKNATYAAGHHGNVILSKHPFDQAENINVSPFTWASRSLLHGVLHLPGTCDIHVVCIHFGLTGKERRLQLARLCERIESHVPHTAPLLVAGDFNDWRGQAERELHAHLDLQEVFRVTEGRHARTFPVWMPLLPMDRIYYRGMTPHSCQCLTGAPWQTLSDHTPLMASFDL